MKYFIQMMLIFLVLFLSIGFVSADDLNDTVMDTSNSGSFSDLQDLIDKSYGVVELDCDYIQDGTSKIVIDKSITINGNNHVLDARSASQIIRAGSNVILNDIIFKNGIGDDGGAVNLYGGTVNNCTFINNTVVDGRGGALYLQGGYLKNSRFIDNHVTSPNSWSTLEIVSDECPGGAVYAIDSTVENSLFENNTANVAGAIYIQGILNNCTFISNTAHGLGGAIYASDGSDLKKLKLYNNSAYTGGAIDSYGTDISDVYAVGNGAYFGGVISALEGTLRGILCINNTGERGGALSLYNNTLYDSYFESNTADLGGAVEQVGTDVYNSTFIKNHGNDGGALTQYILDDGVNLKQSNVYNCIFIENVADYRGGVVSQLKSNVYDSLFVNNSAEDGGAVYSDGSHIENCEFIGNSASNDGGAVYQIDHSSVSGSRFINNTASKHGGAVYETRDSSVDNSTFRGNHAGEECDNICIEHIHSQDWMIGDAVFWQATADEMDDFAHEKVDNACGNPIGLFLISLFGLVIRKKF